MSRFHPLPLAAAVAAVLTSPAALSQAQSQAPSQDQNQARFDARARSETTLAPVTVRSSSAQEAANQYTLPATRGATGLLLPLKQTPQSLSVVTERQISDQASTTLTDVLTQTPGVYRRTWGNANAGYTSYIVRGQEVDNYRVDGMMRSSLTGTQNLNNTDSEIYESVTLVRGSTGLLSPSGNPAGIVELVRKRPSAERRLAVEAGIGSWQHYRAAVDASGALNEDRSLRGRAVVVHDRGGEWQRRADQHRTTLYGIVEYDLAPRTLLTAGLQYNKARSTGSSMHGFETYYGNDASGYRRTPFGPRDNASASWAYHDQQLTEVFAALEHQLANGWKVEADYSHSVMERDQVYGIAGTNRIQPDGSARMSSGHWQYNPKEHNAQVTLDGDYRLLGMANTFQVGVSFNHLDDFDNPLSERENTPVANVFSFDGNIAQPSFPTLDRGGQRGRSSSVFGATHLNLSSVWSVVLGARLSNWQHTDKNIYSNFAEETRKKNGIFSPFVGVLAKLTPATTAYASYNTIFRPLSERDANERTLDPEEGSTYELGLKGEWLEGRLNASAAVFEVRKDGTPVRVGRNADGNGIYRAEDGTKGRGWELALVGEPAKGWQIHAGYTRVQTKDASGSVISTNVPRHLLHLFGTHDIGNRWTVGGGVRWQSRFRDEPWAVVTPLTQEAYTQKAYATIDLLARYRLDRHLSLSLNAINITDEHYVTGAGTHSYGSPRAFLGTLRYEF